MRSSRSSVSLPQPPWSQAPAEVEAWLASTGNRRARLHGRSSRQLRVREFVGPCSPVQERRLRHRLERLRFEPAEGSGESVRRALDRLAQRTPPKTFHGRVASARLRVRLREGVEGRVEVTFTPRLTKRTAAKVISRLGLDPVEGHWL